MAIEPQTPRITKSTIDKQRDLIEIYDASTGVMKVTTPGDLAQENPEGFLQIEGGVTIDSNLRYVVDKDGTQSPLMLSTSSVTSYGGGSINTNTAFGNESLYYNTTGTNNTAFGRSSSWRKNLNL